MRTRAQDFQILLAEAKRLRGSYPESALFLDGVIANANAAMSIAVKINPTTAAPTAASTGLVAKGIADDKPLDPISAALKEVNSIRSENLMIQPTVDRLNAVLLHYWRTKIPVPGLTAERAAAVQYDDATFIKKVHFPVWDIYKKVGLYSVETLEGMTGRARVMPGKSPERS